MALPIQVVVALLLASIYAAECKGRPGLAGILYGIACSIKLWPLFLGLAFMLSLKTWRARFYFGAMAFVIAAALAFPHILAGPWLIISRVFGYRSVSGAWGLSIFQSYVRIGIPFTFTAITVAVVYLRKRNASLSYMAGISIIVFLVLTPGFGVQYLAWMLPFCCLFGDKVMIGVYATSSAFATVTYTFLSGGIPWYFADALSRHGGYDVVLCIGAVCWITLAASAVTGLRFAGLEAALRNRPAAQG